MTELALAGAPHFPAEDVGHQLHAVADAKDRRAEVEQSGIALGRASVGDALRPAGKNDAGRLARAQDVERGVEWDDFRVDVQLTETTSDELRVLRAEVQNEDRLV